MIEKKEIRTIQYKCRFCGKTQTRSANAGKPDPGICPRKANGGPHTWIINRKY